jgi:hypothetical protein
MSLINNCNNTDKKVNKTKNMKEYMKEYRESHNNHLKAYERNKYYKRKYELDDNFLSQFGTYSGDVFKIKNDFNKIKINCPELLPHILDILKDNL